MLLDRKNIYYYLFAFSLIVLANYFGSKFKTYLAEKNDEYDMIKKYLLNDDNKLQLLTKNMYKNLKLDLSLCLIFVIYLKL